MLLHDAKLSVSMALPQNSNFYLICPELQEQTSIPEQQPAAWILRSGLFYCEAVWIRLRSRRVQMLDQPAYGSELSPTSGTSRNPKCNNDEPGLPSS